MYSGPEALQKYFPGANFFFPQRKKFVAARHPNLKLFQSFYETMRETANKLQEFPTSYSTKSSWD